MYWCCFLCLHTNWAQKFGWKQEQPRNHTTSKFMILNCQMRSSMVCWHIIPSPDMIQLANSLEWKKDCMESVPAVPTSSPQLWWRGITKSSYSVFGRTVYMQTVWPEINQWLNQWSSLFPVLESESQCGYFTTNKGCLDSASHEVPLSNKG